MHSCPGCGALNRETARYCTGCGRPLVTAEGPFDPVTGHLRSGVVLDQRYRIVQTLGGRSAMGVVYLAQDLRFQGVMCAVKELLNRFADPLERQQASAWFEREALLLSRLQHPNIPRVSDHFTENGRHYLVMDYIRGANLEEILAREGQPGLPEERVVDWALQICGVLEFLHAQSPPVIFRDLKPANVMLDEQGQIKLIDFGIARFFDASRTGTAVGTLGYAPKEQHQGMAEPRSDIYALGATVHHLVSGRSPVPFDFPSLRALNPAISPGLDSIILKALSERVSDRQQTVQELRDDLENLYAAVELTIDFVHPILDAQSAPLCQFMLRYAGKGMSAGNLVQNHYCLVLDVSGSMWFRPPGEDVSEEKYWPMLRATQHLVSTLRATDLVTIILFAKQFDVVCVSQSAEHCCGMSLDRPQGGIDSSYLVKDPGNATNLAGALAKAIEIIDQIQRPNVVHRMLVLTDGQIHDAGECRPLFERVQPSATEVYAYGFGIDWNPEHLQPVRSCLGGTVKPVSVSPSVSTYDIVSSFSRFAQAKQNVVATDVELQIDFMTNVMPGDAFRFSPVAQLLGSGVYSSHTFRSGTEAIEQNQEYAWCFEARLQPGSVSPQQIGLAILHYTYQGRRVSQRQSIVVERHADERRYKLKLDDVAEVFAFLEFLRSDDPLKQLRSLKARLEIALHKGHDPEHITALRNAITALERGGRLEELSLKDQIWVQTDPRGCTHIMGQ